MRLERLMRAALAQEGLTIQELGAKTGYGRSIGAVVRGEVRRLDPEQASKIVRELPITMGQLLEACGYAIGVTPTERLPAELVALWPSLPPEVQQGLLALARSAARPDSLAKELLPRSQTRHSGATL